MKKYLHGPWGHVITHAVMHWMLASIVASVMVLMPVFSSTVQAQEVPALTQVSHSISANQVIDQTNALRRDLGVGNLSSSSLLTRSAQMKAEDMAAKSYFAHENSDGQRLAYWLGAVGYNYRYAGENLAVGFTSTGAVMNGWINSPTHYDNLVKPEYREIGVGVAQGIYENRPVVFVVQHFGVTQQLLIPVTQNANIAVKPNFVPEPIIDPVATQTPIVDGLDVADLKVHIPALPATNALIEVAQAKTENSTPVSIPVARIPDALMAIIALFWVVSGIAIYQELENTTKRINEHLARVNMNGVMAPT